MLQLTGLVVGIMAKGLFYFFYHGITFGKGGIDGCLLMEPPTLVLVFIYQARLNAIYTAKLS